MVRNVKQNGFSFVEILVSMVILSIVVLVMTNVLVTSSRSHGKASSEDTGDMLALEKLAELQNHVIPAQDGDDVITKNNVEYTRVWVIEDNTPPRVKVTITWTDVSGNTEEAEVIGYIDNDNTCPGVSGRVPDLISDLDFHSYLPADETNPLSSKDGRIDLAAQLEAHQFIAKLIPTDANHTAGEDNISYTLTTLNSEESFYIKNDTLFSAIKFETDKSYNVDVEARDCDGGSVTANLLVTVSPIDFEIFQTNFEVMENKIPSDIPTMTVFASEAATDWNVSSNDADVSVSITAATDGSSAEITITNTNGVDFEAVTNPVILTVSAKGPGATTPTTVACELKVTDIAEIPTSLSFATTGSEFTSIERTSSIGSSIDKLDIEDPDTTTSASYTFIINSYSETFTPTSHQLFRVPLPNASNEYSLVTNVEKSILETYPAGNYKAIVKVTDNAVSGSSELIDTLTVALTQTGTSYDCNSIPVWSSTKVGGYNANNLVKWNITGLDSIFRAQTQILSPTSPGNDDNIWLGVHECP